MPARIESDVTYAWRLLRAGPIALDAGGMFGIIPRAVWSREVTTDPRHRLVLAHNCLLLEARDGSRILIESGSGGKFDPKQRDLYGLGDRTVLDAVKEMTSPADVRHVIVTHLHFDHAGGLTRLAAPGERPHFVDPTDGRAVVRTFGDASIIVQAREWRDARANTSVMTRTYLRENLEPLADRLQLVDSPPPFPAGVIPGRDALPEMPLEDRMIEVLPGIFVFLVPGHTWGQQAILFRDDRGRIVVFTPDVMPTSHHVGAAYSLAYDVEPYTTMLSKRWLLTEAAARGWLLVLCHEPATACVRVRPGDKGWFQLESEP